MKRINFKTVSVIAFLALFAGSAFAQTGGLSLVPKYVEMYNLRTNRLESKMWNNENHLRIESVTDGITSVMICRSDSMKAYKVDDAKKTLTAFPLEQLGQMFSIKSTNEFVGKETVEGFECEHYRTKTVQTAPNGSTTTTWRDSWWYAPYTMEIKCKEEGLDAQVSRNIKLGAQPASLFELPKDYRVVNLGNMMDDLNNMMEQMKTLQNQQGANDADEQKAQDLLKMLEGLNK